MITHKCDKCNAETLPYIKLELSNHYSMDFKTDPDYECHDRKLMEAYSFHYGETCLCFKCSLALVAWIKSPYVDMRISRELGTT
jgi:hypothetical protein